MGDSVRGRWEDLSLEKGEPRTSLPGMRSGPTTLLCCSYKLSPALGRLSLATGPPCSWPLLQEQKVLICNPLKSVFSSGAHRPGETFSDGRNLGCGHSWRPEDESQRPLSILQRTGHPSLLPLQGCTWLSSVIKGAIKGEEREGCRDVGELSIWS